LAIAFTAIAIFISDASIVKAQTSNDPLPSWNDGLNKKAILDFVDATTTEGKPDFVPASERVATFDQDGTLWVEQPLYVELEFAIAHIKSVAPQHPEWKTTEPFASILSGDESSVDKFAMLDIQQLIAVTHSGVSVEDFKSEVKSWIATAQHPRFHKPYTQLVYKPMWELMQYLQSKGFATYIVTGGGQDYVRAFANQVYHLPPEKIIGTASETKYVYGADGKPDLIKQPKLMLLNNYAGKASGINFMIGRKPNAAFGNSIGDQQMLEWTESAGGKRLMMLVHHDDAVREYSYGPDSKVGTFTEQLMDEAKHHKWCVISIKDDWKEVF
jgi:phosphoglycolate phosphatase-like HAD superfamily hydrolase